MLALSLQALPTALALVALCVLGLLLEVSSERIIGRRSLLARALEWSAVRLEQLEVLATLPAMNRIRHNQQGIGGHHNHHIRVGIAVFVLTVAILGVAGVLIQQGADTGTSVASGLAAGLVVAVLLLGIGVGLLIRRHHPIRSLEH